MDSGDDELMSLLDASVTSFLAQRHEQRRSRNGAAAFDVLWGEMAELGLVALTLPTADGGAGLGHTEAGLIARRLAEHLAPEPFAACAVMPAALIAALPPGEMRASLAAALTSGSERLTIAWQEADGPLSRQPIGCKIDAAGRVLGEKFFVVAPDRRVLVSAVHAGETAVGVVDLTQPGIVRTDCVGTDGVPYAILRFEGADLIGKTPLLCGPAASAALDMAIEAGLLANAAQLTGLIAGALDLTLEYLRNRVQFGRPIGAFQALQHRAVDMRIALALSEASLREAHRLADQAPASAASAAAISAAKARAASEALAVCKEAIQLHGAIGFTDEADVGLFAAAALKAASWLGGPHEHRRRFVAYDGELIHGL
jgi:alkylation response protein AidB-like acyl-CoA dehydrogenase